MPKYYQDTFDRDHAHLYKKQPFDSEHDIAKHKIKEAYRKLEDRLKPDNSLPEFQVAQNDLKERDAKISQSEKFVKACLKLVEQVGKNTAGLDEENRQRIG